MARLSSQRGGHNSVFDATTHVGRESAQTPMYLIPNHGSYHCLQRGGQCLEKDVFASEKVTHFVEAGFTPKCW